MTNTLFHIPQMFLRVKRRRYIDPDVIAEREEYQRKMTEYRKWNKAEYEKVLAEVNKKYYDPESEELPPVRIIGLSQPRG
jgi:hypothetical protein